MDNIISSFLSIIQLGRAQSFNNMVVFPLLIDSYSSPKYMVLKDAIDKGLIIVTEVGEGGSVPELKVRNNANEPVLLLDGEELSGGKQNRVLNTSILLQKNSETVIPVSCTEQGRWHYTSREFQESSVVVSPGLRAVKASTVTSSLDRDMSYRSDQGAIWDEIHEMAMEAGVSSPTGAFRDVVLSSQEHLKDYVEAFKPVARQRGLIVLINGKVRGMDILSRESAYNALHQKLVQSYAMDAMLMQDKKSSKATRAKAKAFLKKALACEEKRYKSVGLGWDYRFLSKVTVGSALVYRKKVIHMAFFDVPRKISLDPMARASRRVDFRGWEI